VLSPGIAWNNSVERNTTLSDPYGTTDELFESVLCKLSTAAFKAVVNNGVRDFDAFLMLDTTALADVSSGIAEELSAVQQRIRQNLCTHSVEHPTDPAKESQCGSTPNDPESLAAGDDHLFQLVLESLGVRARHALAYGHIENLQQFMCLDRDVMARWPNTGAKTIAEIMDVQRRVKEHGRGFAQREASDADGPRKCLKRPLHRVGQRSFQNWGLSPTAVAHGVDEPAPWSLLRKTIPDIFPLGDHELATLWVSAGERSVGTSIDLPEDDWQRLAAAAIYKEDGFDVLLAVTLGYLVESQISPEAFDAIVDSVTSLVRTGRQFAQYQPETAAIDKPIVTPTELAAIRGFRVDSFEVPEEHLEHLRARGVQLWGDLASVTERGVLKSSGLCLGALRRIREIWQMKLYAQVATQQVSGLPDESCSSFACMVESFVELVARNDKDRTIALGRMGLVDDRKATYDELGETLGLTRARVQQLWQKMIGKLRSPTRLGMLSRFWFAVFEALRLSGGVCMLSELAGGVANRLDWDESPSLTALETLLKLRDDLEIDVRQAIVRNPALDCTNCDTIATAVATVFEGDRDERPLAGFADSLKCACMGRPDCAKRCRYICFSEGYLRAVIDRTPNVLIEDGVAYCRDTWSARRGSRIQLVESILKSGGRPMHFSEVCEQARKLVHDDACVNEHNVYSWIGNSANLLLWDRGTYIHRDLVAIPGELIGEIESWLLDKLESGVPLVSVAGAYCLFGQRLSAAGIPSESALYSCLRVSENDALAYPRYPYVVRPGVERLPVSIALEQYVLEAGGLVSSRELKSYAVNDLCIAEQRVPVHLSNIPNVVQAGRGCYIHVENVKLDHSKLAAVISHAANMLSADGHVSVEKLYLDRQVSCLSMGVDSPQMLYAILQVLAVDGIQMPRYPQIMSSDYGGADGGSKGVLNQVADYIASRERPCSFDELEQHFVDELGYSAGTVYNVLLRDSVVRYSRGSLIHLETIEWTDEKQHQLETQAQLTLAKALEAGRCYALVGQVLEYRRLPDLANDVVWTHTLLSELLARDGRFRILGSARNAFVAIPNDQGIETFEDLTYEILKRTYEGACDLESFEQDMREAGIVQKRVTPGMLGDQKRVCIAGHVITLRELRSRA